MFNTKVHTAILCSGKCSHTLRHHYNLFGTSKLNSEKEKGRDVNMCVGVWLLNLNRPVLLHAYAYWLGHKPKVALKRRPGAIIERIGPSRSYSASIA